MDLLFAAPDDAVDNDDATNCIFYSSCRLFGVNLGQHISKIFGNCQSRSYYRLDAVAVAPSSSIKIIKFSVKMMSLKCSIK